MSSGNPKRMVVISHSLYKSLMKKSVKGPPKSTSKQDLVYANIRRANKGQSHIYRQKAKKAEKGRRAPLVHSGSEDNEEVEKRAADNEGGVAEAQISEAGDDDEGARESDIDPSSEEGALSEPEEEIEVDRPQALEDFPVEAEKEEESAGYSPNNPFKESDLMKVSPRISWLKTTPTSGDYSRRDSRFLIPPKGKGLPRTPDTVVSQGRSLLRTPPNIDPPQFYPTLKERLRNTSHLDSDSPSRKSLSQSLKKKKAQK